MDNEFFSHWVPMELVKGSAADAENMVGRIGGIVSTAGVDQEGDALLQDGIDWTYALSKGWFNDEHRAGADNVIGHPEIISRCKVGGVEATRVEGVLYLHKSRAKAIYDTAVAMHKAGGARALGFSVEGKVDARDGNRIVKSTVLNIAITAHPVNANARIDMLKSLAAAAGGTVGYQDPSGLIGADAGAISPLVPQSMGSTAISTYAARALGANRRISVNALALMLERAFPALGRAEVLRVARSMAQSIR